MSRLGLDWLIRFFVGDRMGAVLTLTRWNSRLPPNTGLVGGLAWSSSSSSVVVRFRTREGAFAAGAVGVANWWGSLQACSKKVLSLKPEPLPEVANRSGDDPSVGDSGIRPRLAGVVATPTSQTGLTRLPIRTRASMSSDSGDSTHNRAKVVELGSACLIKSTFCRTISRFRSLNKHVGKVPVIRSKQKTGTFGTAALWANSPPAHDFQPAGVLVEVAFLVL